MISSTRQPVGAGGPHVHRELLVVAAGDQRGERDQRAAAPVEAGAGPDAAPGVLGDQLLEVPGEVGGRRRWRGRRARRRAPRGGRPCPASRTSRDGAVVAGAGRLLAEEVLAEQRGDPLGRLGGRQVRDAVELDVAGRPARRRRSRAAGRAAWPRRRRRRPRGRVRRSRRAGRARRTSARARADLRRSRSSSASCSACSSAEPASGSRSRKPGPNQRSADPVTITGVPDTLTWPIRPGPHRRRRRSSRRCRAARPRRPGRGGRAAAGGRPRRRPSRRRRRSGRRRRRARPSTSSTTREHAGGELGHRERLVGHGAVVAVARAGPRRRTSKASVSPAAQATRASSAEVPSDGPSTSSGSSARCRAPVSRTAVMPGSRVSCGVVDGSAARAARAAASTNASVAPR